MARVGLHGYVQAASKYLEAIPYLDMLFSRVENALNGQIDSTNLADNAVTTSKITDLSVTPAKISLGSLTTAQMADGVGVVTSLTYVGDGTTASRTIALTFTPRYALILRTDATFITFESIAVSGTSFFWYRDTTGAQAALTANFQGIVTNGVKLGTSATGTSNAAGITYALVAYR